MIKEKILFLESFPVCGKGSWLSKKFFCQKLSCLSKISSDMVKHELRVTSCELRVQSLKTRVETQKCEFESNPRVTSLNPRVQKSLKTQWKHK